MHLYKTHTYVKQKLSPMLNNNVRYITNGHVEAYPHCFKPKFFSIKKDI